jgi:hypothetical protein
MAALITTPTFTESLLYGPDIMTRSSSTIRKVIDLRAKYGARILVQIGRSDAVALSVGVAVRVNRILTFPASGSLPPYQTGGPFTVGHPAPEFSGVGQIEAATATSVNSNTSAGALLLNVATSMGFAAGDVITIGTGDYNRWEVRRLARIPTGGVTLQVDAPLQFAHTAAQADVVVNKADCYVISVDGGSYIEALVDYGASATGNYIDVAMFLQTYDNDSTS